jgi:hypothetical protein
MSSLIRLSLLNCVHITSLRIFSCDLKGFLPSVTSNELSVKVIFLLSFQHSVLRVYMQFVVYIISCTNYRFCWISSIRICNWKTCFLHSSSLQEQLLKSKRKILCGTIYQHKLIMFSGKFYNKPRGISPRSLFEGIALLTI